jgi:uncharacterized phage-associated protein
MYDSRTVANEFLRLADENGGDTLTPMQVLKLVYLAHGWSLGLLGKTLVEDQVQAWQYGPVIPKLYASMRQFKSNPVSFPLPDRGIALSDEARDLIKQIYDVYGHLSGPALSRLTHKAGSPWAKTYVDGSFGLVISNDLIEDYFAKQAATDEAA